MTSRIHASAIIEDGAKIGEDVEIGPWCHVGRDAVIGNRVKMIGSTTVLGHTAGLQVQG